MTRAFEVFVAARYLKAKRRQAFISVITVISVLGVAAGVMALVIAIAVNNGFRNSLERNLLGATPHVVLLEKEPSAGIEEWRELAQRLRAIEGVEQAVAGAVWQGADERADAVVGKHAEGHAAGSDGVEGSFARGVDRGACGSRARSCWATQLARRTGMLLNSWVTLVSPQGEMTPFGPRALQVRYRVVGLFESGFYDLDNHFAFVSLESAQRCFRRATW
jgi:lipoprotein-releasing system permease protein